MKLISASNKRINKFSFEDFIIYNAIFEYIDSNMYVIIKNQEALIIDPNVNNEILEILNENKVKNVTILLTHEHPDHISGVFHFQEKFNSVLICSKNCSDYISQEKNVRPLLINFILEERDQKEGTHFLEKFNSEFVAHTYKADVTFEDDFKYNWQSHDLEFFRILGHSRGSCAIIIDGKYVFTGDTLLKSYPIITRFPGGSTKIYKSETLPLLESRLNPEMRIFPGHGEPFVLKEIMEGGKINVEFK